MADLGAPFSIDTFDDAVGGADLELVLHPRTRTVRIRPVGASCLVQVGVGVLGGGRYPLADGELSAPFSYGAAPQTAAWIRLHPRGRARVEGRSLTAVLAGPGDIVVVSEA